MKKRKRWIAVLLCSMMVLSGCGRKENDSTETHKSEQNSETHKEDSEVPSAKSETQPTEVEKKYKIGYITSDPSDGFWKEVLESFQAACNEKEQELSYQIVEDATEMKSAFDSLIAQDVDIIVDGFAVEEVAISFAEEAVEMGMPFLTVAFNCEVDGVYSY